MKEGSTVGSGALLIGVGSVGCELAAGCRLAGGQRRLVDFNSPSIAAYAAGETVVLGSDADDTDDMSPEMMREAAREAAESLAELVEGGSSFVLLLGALGGQTGTFVLPTLARELKNAGGTAIVVALEPFPFEGGARTSTASQAIGDLEHVADLVLVVPNRPLAEICDPSLPVDQALHCLKHKAAEAVGQLLEAFADGSCVGLQPQELRRSLTEAGRGAFGIGMGRGEKRVEDALRDACASSFLTQESCQHASAAILHLRGGKNLTLQEVYNATSLVGHLVGPVPILAGLSADGDGTDDVRATLLVTGIRPARANGANGDVLSALGQDEGLSFYEGVNLDVPAFIRRKVAFRVTQ